MAVLRIIRMGHPTLSQVAEEVTDEEIGSESLQKLIDDLEETMIATNGIGIAAPQVNISKQVALIKISSENPRYPEQEESELIVFINPIVEFLTDEVQGFWEGCLSVPDLRGYVERPKKIKVTFKDRKGKPQELIVDEFLACVFQHELDHLKGELYVDKVKPKMLMFEDEFAEFILTKD